MESEEKPWIDLQREEKIEAPLSASPSKATNKEAKLRRPASD
jgi:hypothetical protein